MVFCFQINLRNRETIFLFAYVDEMKPNESTRTNDSNPGSLQRKPWKKEISSAIHHFQCAKPLRMFSHHMSALFSDVGFVWFICLFVVWFSLRVYPSYILRGVYGFISK